jgi:hypothetical protein
MKTMHAGAVSCWCRPQIGFRGDYLVAWHYRGYGKVHLVMQVAASAVTP